jgi:hypothetical protein
MSARDGKWSFIGVHGEKERRAIKLQGGEREALEVKRMITYHLPAGTVRRRLKTTACSRPLLPASRGLRQRPPAHPSLPSHPRFHCRPQQLQPARMSKETKERKRIRQTNTETHAHLWLGRLFDSLRGTLSLVVLVCPHLAVSDPAPYPTFFSSSLSAPQIWPAFVSSSLDARPGNLVLSVCE